MALILTAAAVHLIALVSPGPDFVIVSRNSLSSRRAGLITTLGITLGMCFHIAYSLLGIGFVIAQSILLFNVLKYAGAAYLIYIGWKCLRSKPTGDAGPLLSKPERIIRDAEAFRMGFLCNVLNPKATLFFLALFTQIVDVETPIALQLVACGLMMLDTFLWFAAVALLLSTSALRSGFRKVQHILERIMGALLIGLGLRVALSRE